MYAVEFQTTIKDGMIEIPREYAHQFRHEVRVILLADEQQTEQSADHDFIDHLLANPVHIPEFKPISRDEIYERSSTFYENDPAS